MAYIKDIMDCLGSDIDYKITIINNGITVEGFKSIIYYSREKLELRVKKLILCIEGENLVIKDMLQDIIMVNGNVVNVKLQGVNYAK